MYEALVATQLNKVPQEASVAKDEKLSEDLSTVAGQTIKEARAAMENYLDFFQKTMSASPWAGTELNNTMADYAQQNIATAFGLAHKLAEAKNLPDLVRIQTEFMQTQMKSLHKPKTSTGRQRKQRQMTPQSHDERLSGGKE